MATIEQTTMIQEIYQTIKDNRFKKTLLQKNKINSKAYNNDTKNIIDDEFYDIILKF